MHLLSCFNYTFTTPNTKAPNTKALSLNQSQNPSSTGPMINCTEGRKYHHGYRRKQISGREFSRSERRWPGLLNFPQRRCARVLVRHTLRDAPLNALSE
ncbi:hypothetical protein CEXT_660981 [Caerostris extrusa]|uniref:Uncharacterized protein n=1 Tax=Caerostris extrusa TaxID=172846 RepID=A0AAV4SY29_CAEEX|nr:hypothetical protein CEXT_660981 [Caerostris extrusa]